MSGTPTLVFIPGSWHKPTCYDKVLQPLRKRHNVKCLTVTLPSTTDNPDATFKDDIDAARNAILGELREGRNVVVVAHSYGGMVGNSAINGLTLPKLGISPAVSSYSVEPAQANVTPGHVIGLVLIASGFTITGLAFMDPFFGIPPPAWRINKETGYAELVANPRDFFYHDVPDDEAAYWVNQLTTQSLKSLFEGGEHAYSGWWDVPTWYVGTIDDRGLPVMVQRIQVSVVRAQGATVYHTELQSGHSPFLSLPDDVVNILLEAVEVSQTHANEGTPRRSKSVVRRRIGNVDPGARLIAPTTWLKYGLPFIIGRVLGWSIAGFTRVRKLWRPARRTNRAPVNTE